MLQNEYQVSSAVLGLASFPCTPGNEAILGRPGDGECYLMLAGQSGAWPHFL